MGEEVIKKVEEEVIPPTGDEDKDKSPEPPSPPPQEVVLRVFMHCEGCARKVRRCLKGLEGVEDVTTDCKTHKVVVKGENADPLKVLERLQKKSSRKVELLSPAPKPAAEEPPKQPEKEESPKQEDKKDEELEPVPESITVVLKVHMHCEACAQEIRKRILKMKGVESAVPDLKNSQVAVKGIFAEAELVDYVHKRTGKHAVIVPQEPGKPEDNKKKEEKKADEGSEKKAEEGDEPAQVADDMPMDMRKNEYYYYQPANFHLYPSRNALEAGYAYPPAPQMFSDENPNACSVM